MSLQLSKAIYLLEKLTSDFRNAYPEEVRSCIATTLGLSDLPVVQKSELRSSEHDFSDVEYIFSTWNMPVLEEGEIEELFPALRHVFYAAGSVKYFAAPFVQRGVRVYSAAPLNAIPVAEYATALITLSSKGFYRSRISTIRHFFAARKAADAFPGNYGTRVGILGLGNIGRRVASMLESQGDYEILAYDPYVDDAECERVGVRKAGIDEIFSTCEVISNHMPDTSETKRAISAKLLSEMGPTATFINTGRGAQVDETALVKTLRRHPLQTAILDVTFPEPVRPWNPLLRLPNAIVTPHIAGSLNYEKGRLGEAMAEELERVVSDKEPIYLVSADDLKRGA